MPIDPNFQQPMQSRWDTVRRNLFQMIPKWWLETPRMAEDAPVPAWTRSRSPSLRLYRTQTNLGVPSIADLFFHSELYPKRGEMVDMMMEGASDEELLSKFPRTPPHEIQFSREQAIEQLKRMQRVRRAGR